nr:MAG TPA: YbfG [Caudoviricetes sp.]
MNWIKYAAREFMKGLKGEYEEKYSKNKKSTSKVKSKKSGEIDEASPELLKQKIGNDKGDPSALHFDYLELINYLYKHRKEDPIIMDECIEYCKADIALYPEFRKDYDKQDKKYWIDRIAWYKKQGYSRDVYSDLEDHIKNFKPLNIRIPSFQQLAIIYEQQKKFDEAIKICELALKYELKDGTKSGFKGRIARIEKKMGVQNK